jgi:hypothetical protein
MLKRTPARDRRGTVAVFVALALTGIVGVTAIAVDGGYLRDKKNQVQAAVDAAAMAGASRLYEEYPTNLGADPQNHAYNSAMSAFNKNGYSTSDGQSTISISVPPTTGIYAGLNGFIEVTLTYNQPRFFSGIFGSAPIPVYARAVARGAWVAPNVGVIVLNYTGRATLNAQGNGAFTETGAPVIVNSNNASAVVDAGNGSLIAPEFDITGNYTSSGNGGLTTRPTDNNVYTGVHPTPDPLAYLPVPTQPSAGNMTTVSLGNGNTQYTLSPGAYTNLPNFNTGDVVIFKQASAGNNGIFYITGGGFNSQGATIQMDSSTTGGMMIYNAGTGSNDKINITGNSAGSVTITPLTDGIYQGMSIFQNRSATQNIQIEGNGTFSIRGTIYGASAMLQATGNGAVSNIGSQYVSQDLNLGGNGNISITYNGNQVARTRIIKLVE